MSPRARPDVMIVGDAASVHVRRLAEGLRDVGRRVEVAGFEGGELPNVPVHRLGTLGPASDRRYLLGIPRLAGLLRSRRPSVVNAHYLTSFGSMTALAHRLAHPRGNGPPIVQTTWGDDLLIAPRSSLLHRALAVLALRSAALATGDSEDLKDAARMLAPSVPWHRFVFGPPARLLLATTNKRRMIVSPRLLISSMRVDVILRAFMDARSRNASSLDGWELKVIGVGPELATLKRLAQGEPAVQFIGPLPHHALLDLLLEASIVISIPESDATSATLLESLAAGVMPVVNDLPANREWVTQEMGEIVTRNPTVGELAAAMQRAVGRQPDIAAIRSAVANSTWEAQLAGLVAEFDLMTTRSLGS